MADLVRIVELDDNAKNMLRQYWQRLMPDDYVEALFAPRYKPKLKPVICDYYISDIRERFKLMVF